MNQITNNSIKYTLLASYACTKLTRGWVATISFIRAIPKKKRVPGGGLTGNFFDTPSLHTYFFSAAAVWGGTKSPFLTDYSLKWTSPCTYCSQPNRCKQSAGISPQILSQPMRFLDLLALSNLQGVPLGRYIISTDPKINLDHHGQDCALVNQ